MSGGFESFAGIHAGAEPPPHLSSPVGGGGPPEGGWRGSEAAQTYPAGPLHHAAHGPPPPRGEEKGSLVQRWRRSGLGVGLALVVLVRAEVEVGGVELGGLDEAGPIEDLQLAAAEFQEAAG